jgi:hypothetical protein
MDRRKFIELSSLTTAGLPFLSPAVVAENKVLKNKLSQNEELYEVFKNPVNIYRPFVRWWWNGDRLSQEELLRELDVMRAAGIGGVEINPIKFPEQTADLGIKSLQWLSNEWIDMLQVALKGAKERGIVCDMIVGSGWPFGGEFLTREEQTQIVALGTKNLKGNQQYKISRSELLTSVDPSIHSPYEDKLKELADVKLVPAYIEKKEDALTIDIEADQEVISVDVPEGDHVLYYLVKLTGYMAVINGAPGANGPVLNHYNKSAVEKYLNRMSEKLTERMGPLGKQFRAFFTDSIELEGANWCEDLFEEFKQRNGYDLEPYFPFILFKVGHMGNAINEEYGARFSPAFQDIIKRVRYDFEVTKDELFKERFILTFHDWCHQNGVKSRMQAYGRECHPLESSMLIDIPECETWLGSRAGEIFTNDDYRGGRAYTMINKFVSSGARFAGKRLVSCEEITNVGNVFNASLEQIKVAGDQSNLSGVTHSILHGFNYSPLEAPFPGWVRYGTFFNERNTWWPFFRNWTDYKARLSAVFQNADLVSDVAIMHPIADLWMTHGPQRDPFPALAFPQYQHQVWEAIHQNGGGADYISEDIIQNSTSEDGWLTFGNRSYKALLLIEVETMLPETAAAIQEFAESGGKVVFIGKEPHRSPQLSKMDSGNNAVATAIAKSKNNNPDNVGLVPAPKGEFINWYRNIQKEFDIKPYLTIHNPDPFVSQLYYKAGNLDIFFFTNYNMNRGYQLNTSFNVEGKIPWIWNPESGKRFIYPGEDESQQLIINFGPSESKLIVFDREEKGEKFAPRKLKAGSEQIIPSPWKVELNHTNGSNRSITLDKLVDFKEREDLKDFAGVISYENNLQLKNAKKAKYLDLGKVHGISEVEVNGHKIGTRWYGSHIYDISEVVKKGGNSIQIKVTSTLGNYMKSLKENEVAQNWTRNQPLHSVGMLGPVKYYQ